MKRLLIGLCLIALLLLTLQAAHAAAAPGYSLDWWTVDGGGGTSQGGGYSLSGTVGQADAGALHGGDYTLSGGFWAQLQVALERLFLPLVRRS